MIRFNAALPVGFGAQQPVRPSEQRQAVGQEQPWEQRSAGQPASSGASRVRLRRLRALTTGTQPTVTDIRHTDIQAMRTEPTRRPAMDIRNTPVLLHMLIPGAMGTRADLVSRITPLPPATDTPSHSEHPADLGSPGYGHQADEGYPAHPGSPSYGSPGDLKHPLTLNSSLIVIRTICFLLPTRIR